MTTNENSGSHASENPVLPDDGPGDHPTEQPTTLAGGTLGPLETIIEKSEETEAKE